MLVALALPFCGAPAEIFESDDSYEVQGPQRLWALVHPTGAPTGPAIFLLDLELEGVVERIELPETVVSPHGLYDDGQFLWLTSLGDDSIYALDRDDGSVVDRWTEHFSEGITGHDGRLWAARNGRVLELDPTDDLAVVTELDMPGVIQDITFMNDEIFVLQNGDQDTFRSVDPTTGVIQALDGRFGFSGPYAMVGWEGDLLVGDVIGPNNRNVVRHYPPGSGAADAYTPLPVEGWVTAVSQVH